MTPGEDGRASAISADRVVPESDRIEIIERKVSQRLDVVVRAWHAYQTGTDERTKLAGLQVIAVETRELREWLVILCRIKRVSSK